jgi:hypothetical protein
MTHCYSRLKFGSAAPCNPSSFIKELPPEFIEHIDLKKMLAAPVDPGTVQSRFDQLKAALRGS